MNTPTIVLLVAFDAYIAYRVVRAWKAIWRFGPLMAAGVASAVAAIISY